MSVPILFLIFNRPDTTQRVFEAIRVQKPKYLFVAADGPRPDRQEEKEVCEQTRNIIQQIDWPCNLKILFRDQNLGCKRAVSSAITWFFEHVEQGIILEDDCLPHPSFFKFCEELLIKYKDDDRIGHISGNCFFHNLIADDLSYDFCSIPHIWGWASWRRVWKNYDMDFSYWRQNEKDKNKCKFLFNSLPEEIYFSSFIPDALKEKGINTWDVQYMFMLRVQNQLSIYPAVNLVTNIGIGNELSTHTFSKKHELCIPLSSLSLPLKHPEYVLRNKDLDNITIKKIFFSWKRLLRYYLHAY
jgi:hypothetical protein